MLAEANREIGWPWTPRTSWPRRTDRVIDQCFDMQERVLLAQRRLHHDDAD